MKRYFDRTVLVAQSALFLAALGLVLLLGARSLAGWPSIDERRALVRSQLVALDDALRRHDAAGRMQRIFPEGACFVCTLHGLAWAELTRQSPGDAGLRKRAIESIEWTLDQYATPAVRAPFMNTQVRNGVFYSGQRNLLVGRYLELLPADKRPADLAAEFHAVSAELAAAFLASPTHHLDSYDQMCWPADNVTALASLLVHDRLYQSDFRQAYDAWKTWTQLHLDPATGLPAGKLDSRTGWLQEPARGCANSWICSLLHEFDPDLSSGMYRSHLDRYGIRRLGFRMFREYPADSKLKADVDSGPIIWGAGVVATGVGLGAASVHGDCRTAADIQALSELFGWPTRWNLHGESARQFLLGRVPVGDAFLSWTMSLPAGPASTEPPSLFRRIAGRAPFLGCLLLFTGVLSLRFYWEIRRRRRKTMEKDALAIPKDYDSNVASGAESKDS